MKFISLDASSAFEKAIKTTSKDNKVIVCGCDEDRAYIEEALLEATQTPKEIIRKVANLDIDHWFNERRAKPLSERDLGELTGEWREESSAKQPFMLASDIMTGEPLPNLIGAKIKTNHNWKIPAYFNFGNWNECPAPELHCAIWKRWQHKYGAYIVAVSNDVIEAYITRPPKTPEEAMELAWEQFLYCPDIVDQGVETIAKLAEVLINHESWYFWWD